MKYLALFLAFLFTPLGASVTDPFPCFYTAPCGYQPYQSKDWCYGWGGAVRGAYFFPTSSKARSRYHDFRYDIQVEITKDLWNDWQLWSNFTWLRFHGTSHHRRERDRINLYPLSFGIKHLWPLNLKSSLYLGAGPNYTWLRFHEHDEHCKKDERRQRFGLTLKSGILYKTCEEFYVDIFVDYLFIPMNVRKIFNVGGFRTGLGFGVHL